jgi:NAD(P)-dependent dehydrogenase (short-subunit alcohol dehydrogenase family)
MKAIITGASRGLGFALARALVRDGWTVVADGRNATALAEAAKRIGDGMVAVAGNVADEAHRTALIERAGEVDLLVNNASTLGATPLPSLAGYPLPALREAFGVNVIAPLALAQAALPGLRARGGTIVNVTSDAATEPYEGWGGYGASKAALEQLSNVLAAEEPAVRVWWFDPGEMRTDMLAATGMEIEGEPAPEDVAVPALLRLVAANAPSGRYRARGDADA